MDDNTIFVEDDTIRRALPSVGNCTTRLGTRNDSSRNFVINATPLLSVSDCYQLVESNELLKEIVTAYPVDGLRLPPSWNVTDTETEASDISEYFESLKFIDIADTCYKGRDAFKQAQIVANIEGNAYLWVNLDDGLDPSEPVDVSRIRSIGEGALFGYKSVSYTQELKINGVVTGGTYLITTNSDIKTVHRSRIIRFEGAKSTGDRLREMSFRNPSRLQSVYDSFCSMTSMESGIGRYIDTASLFWHKLDGLAQLAAQKKTEELKSRFSVFNEMVSALGGFVIDANKEDIGFINRNFAGLDPLLEKTIDKFIASSGLTRGRLLKVSSQGAMSESGKSDDRQWASMVANWQSDTLTPKLTQLGDLIVAAKDGPTNGVIVPYSITYPSILPEDNKAKAETYKLTSEADKNYFDMGLSGETIISSRFGGTEFSQSITLDDDYMEESEQTATIEPENEEEEPIQDSSDKINIPTWDMPMTETGYESILALLESGEID